jgi:nucleoside-diphosphate-sugar epimerase
MEDYEKLDVEELYLERDATVLRLPMVYGPNDYQRREEFVLRRVRAGRTRIPTGSGTWLSTHGYVADIARGVRLALESDAAPGEVFNLCETRTHPEGAWAQMILDAAGSGAELVRVPDDALPDDLSTLGVVGQHLLASNAKARRVLGYTDTDPAEALRESVRWHLDNPPSEPSEDFSADDAALERATG